MRNALTLDDYNLEETLQIVAGFGSECYGYLVTPNVDHVIRYCGQAQFVTLYQQATFVLLDSRFLALMVRFLKGQVLRVCPGSDLTTGIFDSIIQPDDVAIIVGRSSEQARVLRHRFGLRALHHIDPVMNLLEIPWLSRLAFGSGIPEPVPILLSGYGVAAAGDRSQALKMRGIARGLALCVGASINFVTGIEKRAPPWVRQNGFEWLYRLSQNPKRLAYRYLVRGPRIFLLLWRIERARSA